MLEYKTHSLMNVVLLMNFQVPLKGKIVHDSYDFLCGAQAGSSTLYYDVADHMLQPLLPAHKLILFKLICLIF